MPAPTGQKRVRGVQVFRPFIFGSEAVPFDPEDRPKDIPVDHTHKWKVFVKGVNGQDISHWCRRVQFKLHETYPNSMRSVDQAPFEVEETGWGEFEIAIKLYFVPESGEKPAQFWHRLLLHPYTGDIEAQKENRDMIKSVCYEEIVFSEPVEAFYDILTGGSGKGKGSKGGKQSNKALQTAVIPDRITPNNLYSREQEVHELDRMNEAIKKVEDLIDQEKAQLVEHETRLQELKATEGDIPKKR